MFQRLGIAAATVTFTVAISGGTAVATPTIGSPTTTPAEPAASATDQKVLDVAHRGASAYAPENTLAAIDAARARGATAVELDVQRSKDGELVVMHDTTLTRTTNVESVFPDRAPYKVGDFTLKELKKLDAGSWFDPAYADEPVPTLQEALDRLRKHGLNFYLEVKSPVLYPGIESDISTTFSRNPEWLMPGGKRGFDRLVIQSFDWKSVKRSHDLMPSVPHGLLGLVDEQEIDDYATWADQINPNHEKLDDDYVDAVHDAGMKVNTYTVNDSDAMREVIDMGVDGIISDYPDVARNVIRDERGGDSREGDRAAA